MMWVILQVHIFGRGDSSMYGHCAESLIQGSML